MTWEHDRFTRFIELTRHDEDVEGALLTLERELPTALSDDGFKCPGCPRLFSHSGYLDQHLRMANHDGGNGRLRKRYCKRGHDQDVYRKFDAQGIADGCAVCSNEARQRRRLDKLAQDGYDQLDTTKGDKRWNGVSTT